MLDIARAARRTLPAIAGLALVASCREKPPAPKTDSALAQDLALAQRDVPPQTVFNDAPIGGAAPAAPSPAAPAPRPRPRTTAPRPTPRRENPVAVAPRTTREPSPTVEAPAPTPAPAPAAGVIGAGSKVGMTTNGRVCARSALVGDKYTATVSSETVGSNGAIIPAGATVVLEVASVDRADPIENSQIQFRVRSIDVNGSPHPADGDVATLGSLEKVQTHTGNDRTKVIGGAVAGAVLGRIFGGSTKATVIGAAAGAVAGTAAARTSQTTDACLPEGSSLRLTLSRDVVMRRDGAL
ncbi:MAG TPA: glycine zipper 2TM domain-containing protein [Gemmatimonadaceae bacterium]